ncbi:MAG: bifunctional UDP-N-acetylglucosamine diphosphorylase/glucosamine-1-phosphate N-acetyltransferase GlmU [Synergistaceae bacterium]|jgi:bifunctional UDP-N-acetylglucosamine pyrophosphorylase/glucosamine-1-phosphate N-acetyltransferase|nr:bifunctional UDP-N-acetylglucosamine diphosphorylase/glucosamine-1-phosphate N-acetyltransferase GlmU [Synergistaceae bacterium]
MSENPQSLGVLVLAAGRGTRMRSDRPKVLQSLLEEPVIYYTLSAVRSAGLRNIAVLVGYRGEEVEEYIEGEWPGVEVIWQREQLGAGHAVKVAEDWWKRYDNVLVLSGDVPLVRPETLSSLVSRHLGSAPRCTLMSFMADDPSGYGRIERLADGGVRIVEEDEAQEEELLIQEINAGVYLFDTEALSVVINEISNDEHEYYITDAVQLIGETEGDVSVIICDDKYELLGVNTPNDLAVTAKVLNKRIVRGHMLNGLKCMDPASAWIGPMVEFGRDVFVEPGAQIWGRSSLSDGSRIGAHSTLRNVTLGACARVIGPSVISDAVIGDGAEIGPFAFMRDGVSLGAGAKIGRFVEIKNSVLGDSAKVPHLSYIGDASVGKRTNVGAGTVTCNYDGVVKNRTEIGEDCFIGSDTMFVAPVSMGDGSSTAAGSVITKDIPDGALAIARQRQTNIDNWRQRKSIAGDQAEKAEEN